MSVPLLLLLVYSFDFYTTKCHVIGNYRVLKNCTLLYIDIRKMQSVSGEFQNPNISLVWP